MHVIEHTLNFTRQDNDRRAPTGADTIFLSGIAVRSNFSRSHGSCGTPIRAAHVTPLWNRSLSTLTTYRNDHPVGVKLPIGPEWAVTDGTIGTTKLFDTNTNGRLDKNDVRFYDSGDGPKVECATCHDPHGFPSGGAGSTYIPTFMRKSNSGSALCLVCHVK